MPKAEEQNMKGEIKCIDTACNLVDVGRTTWCQHGFDLASISVQREATLVGTEYPCWILPDASPTWYAVDVCVARAVPGVQLSVCHPGPLPIDFLWRSLCDIWVALQEAFEPVTT